MAVSLVQSASAATAVVSPVSITPTLGVASTAGNLLILVVAVTGTTPSITTPAGWTSLSLPNSGSVLQRSMIFPNNPGGITAVAVTIAGTGGGAVASIFEFSGVPLPQTQDFSSGRAPATLTVPPLFTTSLTQVGELEFYSVASPALTFTPDNDALFSASIAGASSTNGTPNARIDNFWAIAGISISQGQGSSSGTGWTAVTIRFLGGGALIGYGAGGAVFASQGGNPAGSLQTPQPQGSGNFYSGSSGSF